MTWSRFRWLAPLLSLAALAACGRGGAKPESPAAGDGGPEVAAAPAVDMLPEGTVEVVLLYSNNVDGDTEPCG